MNEEMKVRSTMQPMHGSPVMSDQRGRGGSKLPWIVLVLVIVVIGVVALLFRDKWGGKSAEVKSSGYQAVFLTNGQVYFGKIDHARGKYVTMTDIFYLQVQNPPIQGSQEQANQQQPKLSLVKLGEELHGPVDEMHINPDQILFYEDMQEEGKVMQAIKEYKANPKAGQSATPPPAAQQQTQTAPPAAVPTATPTARPTTGQ